jgi:hypothetical protein
MSAFVNIARNPAAPLYVDAESITAIIASPETGKITIYDKNGPMEVLGTDGKEAIDSVVQKLRDHGFPIVPLSFLSDARLLYVMPSAVAFMTKSQPQDDGLLTTLIGINGVGRLTFRRKPEDAQVLLDTVIKNRKKAFSEFQLEDDGEEIYIDAKAVKAIQATGNGTGLLLENSLTLSFDAKRLKDSRFLQALIQASGALKAVPTTAGTRATYLRLEDVLDVTPRLDKDGTYRLRIRIKQEHKSEPSLIFWCAYPSKEACIKAAEQFISKPQSRQDKRFNF